MTQQFRIAIGQLNPTVGDLDGNLVKAQTAWKDAKGNQCDLIAFPEMFITGYSTQDLILKPAFHLAAQDKIKQLATLCADGPALAIGGPALEGERLYNAYYICHGGQIVAKQFKHFLPNYNVFDEIRQFNRGPICGPYQFASSPRIASPICEDAWYPDVAEAQVESGAQLLLIPNGSPYRRDKFDVRMNKMVSRVIENKTPLVYVNMVGGQDDQVFDGASFVLNAKAELAVQLPVFEETVAYVDFTQDDDTWHPKPSVKATFPNSFEQDYHAMVLSLRNYLEKTGFSKVLLGLSGGIDSAIVACIAVDALGAQNLRCVMLPSEYTSKESLHDAADIANRLGCHYDTVPISNARDAVTQTLANLFEGTQEGLTEENIQSRLRGLLLMAQSNKFGEMLLTTGNKSEVAVGYSTIYGDMAGGYNPIKDLYKTRVFAICAWRNENHRSWMKGPKGEVIPQNIITKPPSAELRPDQKDSDSLPPYDVLDAILERLVDQEKSVADCVADGFERDTVKRIEHLIYISEYKRFQSAPGTRLSNRAFWLDRRYPIVNRYRDMS